MHTLIIYHTYLPLHAQYVAVGFYTLTSSDMDDETSNGQIKAEIVSCAIVVEIIGSSIRRDIIAMRITYCINKAAS